MKRRDGRHDTGHAVVMVAAALVVTATFVTGLLRAFTAHDGDRTRPSSAAGVEPAVPPARLVNAVGDGNMAAYGALMIAHQQAMRDLVAVELARGRRPEVREFARRLSARLGTQLPWLRTLQDRPVWPVPTESDLRQAGLISAPGEVFRAPGVDAAFLEEVERLQEAGINLSRRLLAADPAPTTTGRVRAIIEAEQADLRWARRLAGP